MKLLTLPVFLAGALVPPASACDLCSIYSAAEAHGEIGKGFFAGAAEQFTRFDTLQLNSQEIPDPAGQHLDSSISQVFAGYNFHERFGVQFNLPVVYRSFQRVDHHGNLERGAMSGMGDVSLLGHFTMLNWEKKHATFRANIIAGIKFPSGGTDRLAEEAMHHGGEEEEGEEDEDASPLAPFSGVHGHDLTLGSGSVDGIVGATVFGRWERFFATADLQYAIRTRGDFGYRFGNDLLWETGPGVFLILKDEWTLSAQLNFSGETKSEDVSSGAKQTDTAMTSVYAGPHVRFTWKESLSAELGVDLPLVLDNSGVQTVPDYRLRAGVTWRF